MKRITLAREEEEGSRRENFSCLSFMASASSLWLSLRMKKAIAMLFKKTDDSRKINWKNVKKGGKAGEKKMERERRQSLDFPGLHFFNIRRYVHK